MDDHVDQQVTTKPRKVNLTKYTIYVTDQRMYIVGSNGRETMFRILEIDLTSNSGLIIMEDNVYFTRNEIMDVLSGLEESSDGGLTKRLTAVGLLGFIKFTKDYYYLCVITKRRPVATIGGHYIYHVDGTELIPVTNNFKKPDRNSEEARFLSTFQNLDLSKTFYFSYTYDVTNSLQVNFMRNKKQSLGIGSKNLVKAFEFNERFVWNAALMEPVMKSFDRIYDWFQPIIHGFVDQAKISIFDEQVYITLIARRSHFFAGARFFKRGVNDQGNVANEVETEQIVSHTLTTSFHSSSAGFYNNDRFTSFVQHRGSIPLYWSQDTAPNLRMAKPPIEIAVVDPYYSSAALHFDDLFKRYGTPVQILNLVKQREKTPREGKLSKELENMLGYLNRFLPQENKIEYTAWDMSRASKSRGQEVIEYLESYGEKTIKTTGFFHNGKTVDTTQLQQGVCRTNCIDCLDRTNAAQFVIGKRALGHQLHALGFIEDTYLEYDSDAVNILTEMFHDHGDTIALQYGGSHLVNTVQTYRKINQWSSHSRDMIESVKRFYSNSFVDAQRQEAINLFLGNYVWEKGMPMLWDLDTDYYLHNNYFGSNFRLRPSYTHWFTDENLKDIKKEILHQLEETTDEDPTLAKLIIKRIEPYPGCFDNYWNEYYVPRKLSTLNTTFEFNMNSTLRYMPETPQNQSASMDLTPIPSAIQRVRSATTSSASSARDRIRRKVVESGSEAIVNSPFKSRKPQQVNSRYRKQPVVSAKDVANDETLEPMDEFEHRFSLLQLETAKRVKVQQQELLDYASSLVDEFVDMKHDIPLVDPYFNLSLPPNYKRREKKIPRDVDGDLMFENNYYDILTTEESTTEPETSTPDSEPEMLLRYLAKFNEGSKSHFVSSEFYKQSVGFGLSLPVVHASVVGEKAGMPNVSQSDLQTYTESYRFSYKA
ncbi:unnamed protein product [Kuraishia capsulata CBS 1993]|uniref:SAC domain-containing protein n=1 Tax=Kuraishia capsulata CBS 1993 TaxID=1382522 RepID=W6MSI5_9ASCO|nr:uncharacterized protein KUCA_T00005331001 [Kuraishia capsulata CBS 1993]CDK29343.1 unnamed protein product [Kuraishia capsulata CBS 1993]